MIKLEDISAEYFFTSVRKENEKNILREYGIENYQQLKNFIEQDVTRKKLLLATDLKRVESKIKRSNEKGVEPKIYSTNGYCEEGLDFTDKYVTGSDLIMGNPTSNRGISPLAVSFHTIARLKYLMSRVMPDGTNALVYTLRNFGESNVPALLEAIDMYEKQVIRQSFETTSRDINLFYLNKDVKDNIVRDSLKEIVLYLIYNTEEELVWGKLTDNQKRLLISSVLNDKKQDQMIRNNLVNVISNYTTLSELEDGIVKRKTLNRFIKK